MEKKFNRALLAQRTMAGEVHYPSFFPAACRQLIEGLLVLDPKARLGSDDVEGHCASQRCTYLS